MRSLEECKAEIFRRSEIKIKQRKKMRNRVIAACIPVCLCVVIGAAGAFSGAFDTKSGNMAQAPESAGWNENGFGLMDAEMVLQEDFTESNGISNRFPAEGESPQYSLSGVSMKEISINGETYWIGEDYETLKEILENLTYSPHKVCRCLPQYKLKTDFGEYGIHLSEGYARCEAGQAKLTAEQIQTLRQIIDELTD